MAEPTKEILKKEAERPAIERTRARRVYTPPVDIIEKKGEILVLADVPGVDETSVDITLENDVLSIYAKVEAGAPDKVELVLAEYGIGDYQRMFTISNEIDRGKIRASVKDGVLRVVLPKAPPAKTKKIAVKAGA
jgi:HSP20 family molecular chaperone IbpA